MARGKFILGVLLLASGCAPSPLYVERGRIGTVGEIPRDGRGEPIWTEIRSPAPPAPAVDRPVNPGIPVIPPTL